MHIRKKLKYPPYYNICLIKLSGIDYNLLNKEALKIVENLKETNSTILGPAPAIIPKIYNKYYIQIIIKYKNIKDIYNNLKFIISKANGKVNVDVDLNPRRV